MYILHIETSTGNCSAALSLNNTIIGSWEAKDTFNHASILAPAIEGLLHAASVKPEDLAAISVSSGPGSYTGLRVGSATAKGMAFSLGIPIIAVPTLTALAAALFHHHSDATYALPMIDARRSEVYTALFGRNMEILWPVSSLILSEESFRVAFPSDGIIYTCGDGALKIGDPNTLAPNLRMNLSIQCNATHLVTPALELLAKGIVEDPLRYVPFYLKPPNITQPKAS